MTSASAGAKSASDSRLGVAMYDAKPYDRPAFDTGAEPDLRLRWIEARLGPETAELAAGQRVVCAFVNDELSRSTLERLSTLGVELIAMRCAGYNNVDVEAARGLGLAVVRVPAYSPHAVAEHALALLLALNRKTHRAYNRVREGNFSLNGLVGFDLYGSTAGVVGLGAIGRCCAQILRGFGMRVLAYDPEPDFEYANRVTIELVSLEALLHESDIVSLHAPLNAATHHLLDEARFAQMKRGAVLINTSRGGLVDSRAMIQALKSGHLGAAGLDVYEEESEYFFEDFSNTGIGDDVLARLMTFNNVLITSHQGFLTRQALDNIASTTLASIREFSGGRRGSDLRYNILK